MPFRRRVLFPVLIAILHLYIGLRVLPHLPVLPFVRIAGAVLLALSFLLMMLSLLARMIWPRPQADRAAAPGLLMAGFFSSLLVLTVLRDLVLLPLGLLAGQPFFEAAQSLSAALVAGLGIPRDDLWFRWRASPCASRRCRSPAA